MASRGLWHFMGARTRRSLALSWSALFALSLLLQYFSFALAAPTLAAAGDPVVTLESGVNGCEGVKTTPGSENTLKKLIGGSLVPGGTATFQITFPVDASDVSGRTTFVITDCVFIDGNAALKYSVSFVPNTVDYILTFDLVIPAGTPLGAEYCNYAKTTAAPSQSQASNRKAGPACFVVGGNISILKVNEQGDPLSGAKFTVACTLPTTSASLSDTIIAGETIASHSGATITRTNVTTDADGRIAIQAPVGTSCVITETQAPSGYQIAADPSVTLVATAAGVTHTFVNTVPKTRPSLATQVRDASGPVTTASVGDVVTDRATLDETGGNGVVTGQVDFFVCFNATTKVECTAANATSVSAGANKAISGNPETANSNSVTLSAAGYYCFRAEYDPAGNTHYLATAHSNTTTECVQALAGDVVINKTADAASVSAGSPIGYTITVTNNGAGTATGVKVSDTVPTNAGLNWAIDAAGTTGTWTLSGGILSFGGASGVSLAPGATFHVHITSPTTAATCGTVNNSAAATTTNDGNPSVGPVAITVNCPNLTLTKTADAAGVSAGDPIGFTVTLANTGTGTATGLSFTDLLPSGSGVNWTISPASTGWSITGSAPTQSLVYSPTTLAGGASTSVHVVSATSAASCKAYPNTATVSASNNASLEASASVTVNCGDLGINKTADVGTVNAGDTIGYVITLTNNGAGTVHGVKVSDTLPTNGGLTWTIDAAGTTGTWAIASGVLSFGGASGVDLAAGASVHVHITSPTTSATCGTVNNSAAASSTNDGSPSVGPVAITVNCPDLAVEKLVTVNDGAASHSGTAAPGDTLNYEIAIKNNGAGLAKNVPVSDDISAILLHATYNDDCSNGCGFAAGTLTWTIPTIAAGATVTLSFSVTLDDTFPVGTTHLPNVVVVTGSGSNCEAQSDDSACTTDTTVSTSTLSIDKSVTGNSGGTDPDLGVPAANIGDTLTYSLHYTGGGLLTTAVITDVLPQGLQFVTGSAVGNAEFGSGVYNTATRTITWHALGTLPDPVNGTLTYQVKVLSNAPGFAQPLVNLATIDSDQTAPVSDTASVAVLAPPEALTPPPTDTITPKTGTGNPGFALMLILLGVAGLAIAIGFITPAPARVRRRDRLG